MNSVAASPRRRAPLSALLIAVSVLVTAGCAVSPSTDPNLDIRALNAPFPPPDDLQALSETERIGYAIYRHDRAAWDATDLAVVNGLMDTPTQGWITVEDEAGRIHVRFIGPCPEGWCSYFDLPDFAENEVRSPPFPLPEEHLAMWRARQLATTSEFRACSSSYNSVILPHEQDGEPVWRVYLLAASRQLNELILGGHHRFTISADGTEILQQEALSKACMTMQVAENIAAPMTTHILDDEPIETHVFTSLDYHLPVYVATAKGLYSVTGASIELIQERSENAEGGSEQD